MPYESTVQFIKKIKKKGLKAGVISASRNAKSVMGSAGVANLFDAAVDGVMSVELGLKGKPEPDIFLEAAKRLGVAPGRAAVVEDALAGVRAGRAGGFAHVVGIARDGREKELAENGADIVVPDLSLLDMVEAGESRMPSALEKRDEIFQRLYEGVPIIFLDYDAP